MKLAVVILNWNRAEDTVTCVGHVSGWARLRPDVWVVDNHSEDGSAAIIAERCPTVRLIRSTVNRGFGGGNNLAIHEALQAGSEAILLLNNDATIDEDAVCQLLETLSDRPDAGVVGPFIRQRAGNGVHYRLGGRNIARHPVTHIVSESVPNPGVRSRVVDYVPGTVALLRASMLEHVAPFDEEYFFSGEMADLCARARARGYLSLIVPAAVADHTDEAGHHRETLYAYYSVRNRFLFIRKHGWPWQSLQWTWRCVTQIARHAAARDAGAARLYWLALADGLAGRYGNQHARVQRR